jgi:probable HAF family extracellular repeat protein
MKFQLRLASLILLAVALLMVSTQVSAQQGTTHHHYKLIDVGTFGGPQSFIADVGVPGGRFVNNGGIFTGFADTSTPDPFPSACFWDCFVAHAFRWQDGVLTDIGAESNGLSSGSAWISQNGLIAGFAETGEIDPVTALPELHAALWQNGRITDLGALPGGYESVANAVNSRGQVVGGSVNAIPDPNTLASFTYNFLYGTNQLRAILWQDGAMEDLGTLGGPDALALLVNEQGQVLGWSYTSSTETGTCGPLAIGSFIWEKEKGMTDLGNLDAGTCTEAWDFNRRGQIVGLAIPGDQGIVRAFIWENGSIRDLGGSLGGSNTGALVINDAGEAAGFAYLAGDTYVHAALWTGVGQITDLGVIGTDACSTANDINVRGQVVGDSISLANCPNLEPSRAFLWEDGTILDLNALIPAGSPLYLLNARNVNDQGEVAGMGVDASGNQHAFLLIPCDQWHPGLAGCDYSPVDTNSVEMSAPSPSLTAQTENGATLSSNKAMARLLAAAKLNQAQRHRISPSNNKSF